MNSLCCSVKSCKNGAEKGAKSFSFPTVQAERSQWIQFCGYSEDLSWVSDNAKICSSHFKDEDFATVRKEKLKDGSIPSMKATVLNNNEDPLARQYVQNEAEAIKVIDEMACRICLAEHLQATISLFAQFDGELVAQMLTYCTSLEIDELDSLPKTICELCFQKLKSARELKQTSIASDDYLRKCMDDFKISVKEETQNTDIQDVKLEPIEILTMESYHAKDEEETNSNFEFKASRNTNLRPRIRGRSKLKTKFSLKKSKVVPQHVPIDGKPISECLDCGKQFTEKFFDNHRCKAEKTCSICNFKLDSLGDLLKHFKDMHQTDRKCTICQLDMKSARDLHFHIRTHKQINISYMCDICGKSFYKNRFLKLHRETHTRHYECDLCGVIVSCRSGMSIHMTGIHIKTQKYMCAYCPSEFGRKISWSMHQIRVHGAPAPVTCATCGIGFIYVSQLNIHTRESHLKIRPQDRVTSSYTHKCSICHRVFKHHPALHKHLKNHTKDHTITKAGLKLLKYECNLCTKKFYRRPMLEDHMRVHTGEKPYQCKKCMTCFGTSKTLRVHLIKIHKEISPYVSSRPNKESSVRVPVITQI